FVACAGAARTISLARESRDFGHRDVIPGRDEPFTTKNRRPSSSHTGATELSLSITYTWGRCASAGSHLGEIDDDDGVGSL
ncbi:hypothetical protein HW555_001977, partial [Spodoptera exigua]